MKDKKKKAHIILYITVGHDLIKGPLEVRACPKKRNLTIFHLFPVLPLTVTLTEYPLFVTAVTLQRLSAIGPFKNFPTQNFPLSTPSRFGWRSL